MSDVTVRSAAVAFGGQILDAQDLLVPMGDGPLGRRVWEPWRASLEAGDGGITIGSTLHTEPFCRVSAYLRPATYNARRLCALWNAFHDVPLEKLEEIARVKSGYVAPNADEYWRHPDASDPMKTVG